MPTETVTVVDGETDTVPEWVPPDRDREREMVCSPDLVGGKDAVAVPIDAVTVAVAVDSLPLKSITVKITALVPTWLQLKSV